MEDKDLKSLLRSGESDESFRLQQGLAARVQQRFHRREITRRFIITPTRDLVSLLGILMFLAQPKSSHTVAVVPNLQRELAELNEQATRQDALIDRLLKIESASSSHAHAANLNPIDKMKLDTDSAIGVLMIRANELHKRPDTAAVAEASYRQISTLFPDSPQAQLARRQLNAD